MARSTWSRTPMHGPNRGFRYLHYDKGLDAMWEVKRAPRGTRTKGCQWQIIPAHGNAGRATRCAPTMREAKRLLPELKRLARNRRK